MTNTQDPIMEKIIAEGAAKCKTLDDIQNHVKLILGPIVKKMETKKVQYTYLKK